MFFEIFESHLRVRGEKRVEFLQGLVSNDIQNLGPNQATYAAFLDRFGRVLSDCHIIAKEDSFLILLPVIGKANIISKIEKDAALEGCSIENPRLGTIVLDSCPKGFEDLALGQIRGKVFRRYQNHYDILFPLKEYQETKKWIESLGHSKGSSAAFEKFRLTNGIPLFGIDFNEKTILPQIGQKAISYTKGCYVGQEVIIKIKDRGAGLTGKRLVHFSCAAKLAPQTKIFFEDKEAGFITSSCAGFALGYITKDFFDQKEFTAGNVHLKII